MNDAEKFMAFKENVVKKHEERYGAEARAKYGDKGVDDAQQKVLDMSEEDYERFKMYYDREVPGCAEFLEKAVRYKIGA